MPSRRLKTTGAQALTPVLVGLVVVAVLGLSLWGVAAWLSSNAGDTELDVNLGDDFFDVGPAAQRAEEVAENGPLLYPGLLGPDQGYIFVQHLGTDPGRGWRSFAATPPGSPITCTVQWQPDVRRFVDPCTGTEYPDDGAGLTQYETFVTPQGTVLVDLSPGGNPGQGPSTVPTTAGG